MIPICKPTLVTITILKMIECWNSYVWPRLVTDDPSSIWYPMVSRKSVKTARTREHSGHDGRRSGDLRSADPLFLVFRKKSWKACPEGRYKGDEYNAQKDRHNPSFLLLALSTLTGCHGKAPKILFHPRNNFITSRQYEITFWAKMIRTRRRRIFIKRQLQIFRRCIRTSLSISVCIRIMEKFIMMLSPILPRIPRPTYASPTPRPYRHLSDRKQYGGSPDGLIAESQI